MGIEQINIASPGFLKKIDSAGTTVTPLMFTSPQAMEVDAKSVGLGGDPIALLRAYKPGNTPLVLAARVTGTAKSAFPAGPPGAESDSKTEGSGESNGKPSGEGSHLTSGPVNVIVIADSDIMADQFWVSRREMMGQEVVMPMAHNAALVISALENLSGNDALIALRGRGVTDRPFTWVEDIRRAAERRFREKEQGLTKKLAELQKELAQVETSGVDAALLSQEERRAADQFRADMLETRRELRSVKLALRHDIDRLDGWLKFANIAMIPLIIGVGSIGWALARRRRPKSRAH